MTDAPPQPESQSSPTRKRWLVLALALLLAGFVIVAMLSFRNRARPGLAPLAVKPGALAGWNLLLVSLDTVRADRLGCYGYAPAATPVLDALAADGVRCRQAVAPVPLTLPSHASLLTGLDPQHHGARTNGMFKVGDNVALLGEILHPHGYRTGAVISAYVLDRRYGLSRGFDEYHDDLTGGTRSSSFGFRERTAEQTNELAFRWLDRNARERFFLWVHYFDPHAPYTPPEPYASRFSDRPYDGEIAYVDEQLGRLLTKIEKLGAIARTLVVVVSDHGESLGEHGELTHGLMIYDATMRVPVILSAPGVLPAGLVVDRQVGLIDLAPTVLDLLGVAVPAKMDGRSLVRAWQASPRELYIESLGPKLQHAWAPLMGLRTNAAKFILAPRPELYDLRIDPNELDNLIAKRRQEAERCHQRLKSILGQDPQLASAAQGNLPMDAAARERLKGLGYVFEGKRPPATQESLPDPKDVIDQWELIQRAQTFSDRGEHARAIAVIEPHLEAYPADLRAWEILGEGYTALGQTAKALDAYRQAESLSLRKVEVRSWIAAALTALGRYDEAEAALRQALSEDPTSPQALFAMASLRNRQGRLDEAMELYRKCIECGRGSFTGSAYFNLGAIHFQAGRIADARSAFEKSLEANPGYARAARALAELMRREGRRQEAIDLLRRTTERRADAEVLLALGELLIEDGKPDQAKDALERSLRLRPDLPKARLFLGILLAGQGDPTQAERQFREAIRLAPPDAAPHYNLGVLLARQDKLAEAVQAFRAAIERDPRHANAYNALGQALMTQGHLPQAAEAFRHALRINPKLDIARKNLDQCTTMPTTTTSPQVPP
ncbi:MAG: sulfatase-like hydrolase/transferase [Phycisphaerae bacterium]|nr:sulfatase-like hydrolase/transferase [Phycisphaerae bacterium]